MLVWIKSAKESSHDVQGIWQWAAGPVHIPRNAYLEARGLRATGAVGIMFADLLAFCKIDFPGSSRLPNKFHRHDHGSKEEVLEQFLNS